MWGEVLGVWEVGILKVCVGESKNGESVRRTTFALQILN